MFRVAVVEGDKALLSGLVGQLEDWAHEVLEASHVKVGVELVNGWRPDIVSCDVELPVEMGFSWSSRGATIMRTPLLFLFQRTVGCKKYLFVKI